MDRPGVLANHSVVVRDGRIVDVAPSNLVTPPASAERIDGRGKFLVPVSPTCTRTPSRTAISSCTQR